MTIERKEINLVGRAGREPEIRYFESGTIKCTVSVAVNRNKNTTDWFNIEAWGRTAEIAAEYVKKGDLIGIEGSLKIESWTDRSSGQPRTSPIIKCDRLELLGNKRQPSNPAGSADGYTEF
jgi:single-strand DNA-binding protein